MKPKPLSPRELAKRCCAALADKKAGDLRVLDVSAQSSITDFLVLATATSDPHLRALRVELSRVLSESATHLVGVDAAPESGWLVVDAFDVMVHLFTAEKRDLYSLESLWNDAVDVPVAKLLLNKKAGKVGKKTAKAKTPKTKSLPKRVRKPKA